MKGKFMLGGELRGAPEGAENFRAEDAEQKTKIKRAKGEINALIESARGKGLEKAKANLVKGSDYRLSPPGSRLSSKGNRVQMPVGGGMGSFPIQSNEYLVPLDLGDGRYPVLKGLGADIYRQASELGLNPSLEQNVQGEVAITFSLDKADLKDTN